MDTITASEAGEILGVTAGQVRRYYRDGLLAGHQMGRRLLLFSRREVEKFRKPLRTGRPRKSNCAKDEANNHKTRSSTKGRT